MDDVEHIRNLDNAFQEHIDRKRDELEQKYGLDNENRVYVRPNSADNERDRRNQEGNNQIEFQQEYDDYYEKLEAIMFENYEGKREVAQRIILGEDIELSELNEKNTSEPSNEQSPNKGIEPEK